MTPETFVVFGIVVVSGVVVGVPTSTGTGAVVGPSTTSLSGVSTSSGTSGLSVNSGVPSERCNVFVLGGRVVVVVPESVSISVVTGQVVVYNELVWTVVDPMWHF